MWLFLSKVVMHVQLRFFRCSYILPSPYYNVHKMDSGSLGSLNYIPIIPLHTSVYSPGPTKKQNITKELPKSYSFQHDQIYTKSKKKLEVKVSCMQTCLIFLLLLF